MDGMEEKLSAILANPDMMDTIMSMVRKLGQTNAGQDSPGEQPPPPRSPPPGQDELELISKLSALTQQAGLNSQEQALLAALHPYLSHDRLHRLEKAMHAAKLARVATAALEQAGQQTKFGR